MRVAQGGLVHRGFAEALANVLPPLRTRTAIRCQDELQRRESYGQERWRDRLPKRGGPSREPLIYLGFGPVEQKVVGVATENGVDLIVLKIASARSASAHLAEGLTYEIVRSAPCPVLTIRG